MKSSDTTLETSQENPLGYEKESKLLVGFAIPCIISMLVTALYNIVDQIFIGQGVGMLGNAATNIAFPLSTSCTAISLLLGIGSATNFSLKLGAGEEKESAEYAGNGICLMAIFGIALFAVTTILLTPMLKFFGATSEVLPYAQEYTRITAIGFPFLIANTGMSKLILADGSPRYSMTSMLVGAIVNTILDPIFIFGLNLGISGAALATAFSQCISFGILFFQSLLRKDCVHLKPGKITLSLSLYGEILHGGIPSLCRQGVASIATAALNVAANPFGDAAIAALSIVSRYMMFIGSAMIGFGQGFQPVCGFNFGAKRYDRVLEAFWFCVKVAVVFLVTLSIVSFVGAPQIMRIFRKEDLDVIEIGTWALRFQCVTLPLSAWIVMSNMMTQTIGYGFRASLVAAGRQGLFLIPALFVLPVKFGIRGLQLCQPVADALTFVLGVVIVLGILRELKEKQEQVE